MTVGVGVGVDAADLGRLYFIWLNALEATNEAAIVAIRTRVVINAARRIKRWIFGGADRFGKANLLFQSLTDRNRSAFAITETELKLMAAPAIIGLSKSPKKG